MSGIWQTAMQWLEQCTCDNKANTCCVQLRCRLAAACYNNIALFLQQESHLHDEGWCRICIRRGDSFSSWRPAHRQANSFVSSNDHSKSAAGIRHELNACYEVVAQLYNYEVLRCHLLKTVHICRHASKSDALNMQQSAVDLWQARLHKIQTGMPQDTCLPLDPRTGSEKHMQSAASQARCCPAGHCLPAHLMGWQATYVTACSQHGPAWLQVPL